VRPSKRAGKAYNEALRTEIPSAAAASPQAQTQTPQAQAWGTASAAAREGKELAMDEAKEELQFNLRYAQRLCQRTARFYRRIQTTLTFISLLSGSSAVAALGAQMLLPSAWLMGFFAVSGCLNLAIRPAEKIAANDADVRKYGGLLAKLNALDAPALQQLLDEARLSDTSEVEPLRAVAYNDVVLEIDETDSLIPLTPMQKLMSALA
jgi:hypothetical protein